MARRGGKAGEAGETLGLFVTLVNRARLVAEDDPLLGELGAACLSLAEDDAAGLAWCEANGYQGYTSYASLNDLGWRMPPFKALAKLLDGEAARFAEAVGFDLGDRRLVLDSLWVNVLPEGAGHSGHIHPHAAVSGTFYVAVPEGASALRFEDPRLAMLMAAPPRRADAPVGLRSFVYVTPAAGEALFWESWLRHEVPPNQSEGDRISISFNYRWG